MFQLPADQQVFCFVAVYLIFGMSAVMSEWLGRPEAREIARMRKCNPAAAGVAAMGTISLMLIGWPILLFLAPIAFNPAPERWKKICQIPFLAIKASLVYASLVFFFQWASSVFNEPFVLYGGAIIFLAISSIMINVVVNLFIAPIISAFALGLFLIPFLLRKYLARGSN